MRPGVVGEEATDRLLSLTRDNPHGSEWEETTMGRMMMARPPQQGERELRPSTAGRFPSRQMVATPAMKRSRLRPVKTSLHPSVRAIRSAAEVPARAVAVATASVSKRVDFARWAMPHMDQVYTASLHLTRNREEAEDLLQDTYLRAYRFWHQFTLGTNCKAWLLTILHNSFKNRYHVRYRERQAVEFDEELYGGSAAADTPPKDPETLVLSHMLDDEVEGALKALPPEFLEVIVLVDIQELSYQEAAASFGCPIGTIRSRLARGRRLLQATLQEYATQRGYGRRSACALH